MEREIAIYRVRVVAYLACAGALIGLLLLSPFFFLWLTSLQMLPLFDFSLFLITVLYLCGVAWFSVMWVAVLRYRLTDCALLVDKGILFKSRKTIPLDKITDLELVQGPLLRALGMWIIKVQTAGSGSQMPVARLLGVIDPEQVREEILAAKTVYLKD